MESRLGPIKTKAKNAVNSPYARPAGEKSFFKKVTDFLKPSWFNALTTSPKGGSDRGELFSDNTNSSSAQQNQSHHHSAVATQSAALYSTSTVTVSDPRRQEAVPAVSAVSQSVVPPPTPHSQNVFPANVSVIPHIQQGNVYSYNNQQQSISASTPYPSNTHVSATKRQRRPSSDSDRLEDMPPNVELGGRPSLDQSTQSSVPMSKKPRLILDDNGVDDSKLNRSSFNISSFAQSFSQSMNSSILNSKNLSNSSFYPGKTVYGGGSSRRSLNISTASPYKRTVPRQKLAESRKQQQPGVASRTAKLIMKALDQTGFHATPSNAANKNRDIFSPAVYLRKTSDTVAPGTKSTLANVNRPPPPKVSMQTAFQAKIVSNPYKLPVAFNNVTESSTSNIQVKPLVSNITMESSASSSGAGGKLRRDRGLGHYSFRQEKTTTEEAPMLATGFKLPVPEGAKLNFGLNCGPAPAATKPAAGFNFKFTPLEPVSGSKSKAAPATTADKFSFTSPVKVDDATFKLFPETPKMLQPSTEDTISFGSAKNPADETKSQSQSKVNPTAPAFTPKALVQPSEDKWKCDTCLVQNDQSAAKCVACSSAKPATSKPAGSSWADIFSGNSSTKSNDDKPGKEGVVNRAGGWGHVFVDNSIAAKPQTGRSEKKEDAPVSSNSWGDLFNKPEGQWSCACCLVNNASDKDSCVACGVGKPKSEKGNSPHKPVSDNTSFAASWSTAYKNAGNWRCDVCMIQNDSDKQTCVACQTKKPATSTQSSSSITTATKTGSAATTGWAGVFQSSTAKKWRCDTCMIENDSDKQVCVACQTKKPADVSTTAAGSVSSSAPVANWDNLISTTAGSKWRCDTCMVENSSDKEICVACQTKKPGSGAASTKTAPAVTGNWGDVFKSSAGKWRCDTCMVDNSSDKQVCVACQAKKPDAKTAATATAADVTGTATAGWSSSGSPTSKLTGIWGAQSNASSKWQCTICLISNASNVSLCAACGACKPGTQSSLGELGKGTQLPLFGVKFGSDNSASSVTSKPLSSLSEDKGKQNTSPASVGMKLPSGTFNFGTSSSTKADSTDLSKSSAPTTGGFKLPTGGIKFGSMGTPATEKSDTEASSNQSAPTESAVNNAPADSKQSQKVRNGADITQTAQPLFKLGTQRTDSQKSDSASSQNEPAKPATDSGAAKITFQFGAASATETTTDKATPESSAASSSKPLFQFGASIPTQSTESKKRSLPSSTADTNTDVADGQIRTETKNAVFQFGSSTSTAQQSDTPKPAFQFGAASVTKENTETKKPAFQFGSASDTSQQQSEAKKPLFQFGAAASTSTQQAESSKLPFQFGVSSSSTIQSSSAVAPVSFGSTAATTQTSTGDTAAATFQFGLAKPSEPAQLASQTPFQFGVSSSSTTQSSSAAAPFSFGSTAVAAATQATTGDTAKTTFQFGLVRPSEPAQSVSQAPFQFGGSNTSTTGDSNKSTFQVGASSTTSDKPVFNFGAQPPASRSSNASPATFQFGNTSSTVAQPSDTVQPPSFGGASAVFGTSASPAAPAFGASSNPTNQGIFGKPGSSTPFGAPATTAAGFQFGAAATPSFNFGSGASTVTSASGSSLFQFGQTASSGATSVGSSSAAAAAPSGSASDSGAATSTVGQRQIKRATRRLKKLQ